MKKLYIKILHSILKIWGFSDEEIDKRVEKVPQLVGLKEKAFNAFTVRLVGRSKRRVAIAGVLAMNPKSAYT